MLCVGGHHDEDVARKGLEQAYMQFDETVEDESRLPHRVSNQFCERGCQLRVQGEEFINGKALSVFRELEVALARLAMLVVT